MSFLTRWMLADKTGKAVLFETFDGAKEWKQIDASTSCQYLHATNHAHLPGMQQLLQEVMEHSACRYDFISRYMAKAWQADGRRLKSTAACQISGWIMLPLV